jgi:parvulin-like peptidyl-prolyl isomerase
MKSHTPVAVAPRASHSHLWGRSSVVVAGLLALLLVGCASPTSTLFAAARVNGRDIPLEQYLRLVQINKSFCQLQSQLTGQITSPIDWGDPARRADLAAVRQQSLDELITAELTNEQAAAQHISVDPEQVDQLLSELQQQGSVPPTDLLPSLHASIEDYRLLARQALIQQTLLRLLPQVTTEEARVAWIAVKTPAIAGQVLAQLQSGIGFDVLAGQYSQDRTRGTSGDAGYFVPGQAPAALDQVFFHAQPGEITGPIAVTESANRLCAAAASGGASASSGQRTALYYIVKVLKRDTVPMFDVPNAPNNAQNVAFARWLRQSAQIQVLVDF